MSVTIVLGGQWGDEGKGKITDALAGVADMVVRPNGSANAGHTVETDQGVFKLHLVPSGILRPNCDCVIGAGVAVDPAGLLGEIDGLNARGIDTSRLMISDRANLILPYHPVIDRLEEEARGDQSIGTTLRGNGPAYSDKVARRGLRIADLLDERSFVERLSYLIEEKNALLVAVYEAEPIDVSRVLEEFAAYAERLQPYVVQSEIVVQDAIDAGMTLLIEGAQATMLDVDYGTYPYVTSTATSAAGLCQGAGVGPAQVTRVIGVYKAYTTRVGAGPYPTEALDEAGGILRERGREFGTTTGRPRRTGWFDAPSARFAARINGTTDIALTKLDILDSFERIPICTAYRLGDEIFDAPPSSASVFGRLEPVYEYVDGWQTDTSQARELDELPYAARQYIERIERLVGVPVSMVGLGPHRDQILNRSTATPV
jgi:adenylosuccinate synthase